MKVCDLVSRIKHRTPKKSYDGVTKISDVL